MLCGLDEVRAMWAPSLGDIVTAWRLREFVFLFMSGLRERVLWLLTAALNLFVLLSVGAGYEVIFDTL